MFLIGEVADPANLLDLSLCESSGFLKVLYIIATLVTILKLFVPLLLIIMTSFDVFKIVSNPDSFKNVKSVVFKRLLAAVIVFFVPTIIGIVLESLGDTTDISACFTRAYPECYEKYEAFENAFNKEYSNLNQSCCSVAKIENRNRTSDEINNKCCEGIKAYSNCCDNYDELYDQKNNIKCEAHNPFGFGLGGHAGGGSGRKDPVVKGNKSEEKLTQ